MAVLTVGLGETYATLASAIAASAANDTILVQAGTYVDDFATITHPLTIQGVGGMVHLQALTSPSDGKAFLTVQADLTLDHIEFSGAAVPDANGAGVRYESGDLTITNCWFHDNENGLLGAPNDTGTITIDRSEFNNNGNGNGSTHNIYVGIIPTFTVTNSYFHDVDTGHEIKSRALSNIITNNRIADGPALSASYSIDLPNGGTATISGNVIEKGVQSQNRTFISIGAEAPLHSLNDVHVTDNVFINDLPSGAPTILRNYTGSAVEITSNQLYDVTEAELSVGAVTASDNVFPAGPAPTIDTSHPFAAPACFVQGTQIATETGLRPVEALKVGERLPTASGETRTIRWIGRRSYMGWLAARDPAVAPIRLCRGALADGVPARDLLLSPEHGLLIDGALVAVRHLVNGRSILPAPPTESVEYLHIELDRHDAVLAEGAWAESFSAGDGRLMFDAEAGHRTSEVTLDCAPRLAHGQVLDVLHLRLDARAVQLKADGTTARVRIEGHHDSTTHHRIAGWARDALAPDRQVWVAALLDGVVVAQVCADLYRADLEQAGKGDGRHAFDIRMPDGLDPERVSEIAVRCMDDWALLDGSPMRIDPTCQYAAGPTVFGALDGAIDMVDCGRVTGWARDAAQPDRPVSLLILAETRVIGRVLANRQRPDLCAAGIGQGRFGFDTALPSGLADGSAVLLRVVRAADGVDLPGSPLTLCAPAPYDLRLETVLAEVLRCIGSEADEERALALLKARTGQLLHRRATRQTGLRVEVEKDMLQRRSLAG